MRNARGVVGKVSRWNDQTDQVARWMGVALLRGKRSTEPLYPAAARFR
jgi:hypothetical protein